MKLHIQITDRYDMQFCNDFGQDRMRMDQDELYTYEGQFFPQLTLTYIL